VAIRLSAERAHVVHEPMLRRPLPQGKDVAVVNAIAPRRATVGRRAFKRGHRITHPLRLLPHLVRQATRPTGGRGSLPGRRSYTHCTSPGGSYTKCPAGAPPASDGPRRHFFISSNGRRIHLLSK